MAEVLPPPIHRLCGAFQDAHSDVLQQVNALRANTDKHVLRPLSRLAGSIMTPLNLHMHGALHGALAKIAPQAVCQFP
jgi:hypothetical protein